MIEAGALSIPALKFAVPFGAATMAGVLAVDTTTITVTTIGAIQALVLAWFGWRQARTEQKSDDAALGVERQGQAMTASDRFVDQLQEQLTAEITRATATRTQIDAQALELNRLQRELTALHIGVMTLTTQLEQAGMTPAWAPGPASDPSTGG